MSALPFYALYFWGMLGLGLVLGYVTGAELHAPYLIGWMMLTLAGWALARARARVIAWREARAWTALVRAIQCGLLNGTVRPLRNADCGLRNGGGPGPLRDADCGMRNGGGR